ncbi:MAG TPA: hypothetical protein VE154_04185 [Chthoniobacterales bacterium]|jgi:hypothetical protein|nr:hypothetical protein [Chthoniobacterales bacterium]
MYGGAREWIKCRDGIIGLELADKQQIVSLLKHRSDLFSGISLTIEKPYQLGDEVLLEEGSSVRWYKFTGGPPIYLASSPR